MQITLKIETPTQLVDICGCLDEHIDIIAKNLAVEINNQGANFNIIGANDYIAAQVLQDLLVIAKVGPVSINDVQMSINNNTDDNSLLAPIKIKTKRKIIKVSNKNQQHYVDAISSKDCVFAVGPAGTGKTYLAVVKAVEALEKSDVRRIVLVRPAVEAGEKLGFLPGDLAEKVDPYLRPIYDALYEMLGFDKVIKLIDKGIIEVAPLAFMRGRTLNEAFIILDEAQNTTTEQMKMFLTRMGFGAKMVITGDITQIDLLKKSQSGLLDAINVLGDVKQISFCHFTTKDVVRHNLVQKIVEAYEKNS